MTTHHDSIESAGHDFLIKLLLLFVHTAVGSLFAVLAFQ